mmetsp:Transcript_104832/g.302425  ORF Transcript_104832/g.302425 Transcript_104832/m.302425 type:complete len:214 (+) Transcript_104832:1482-2123(+)
MVGRVEAQVVERARRHHLSRACHGLLNVPLVALVNAREVGTLRELAVDKGILVVVGRGLVKVVAIDGVRGAEAGLEGQRRVRPDQHGHHAAAGGGPRGAGGVDGDVAREHNGVATVPLLGLYPRQRVEQGGSAAIARVGRGHALNVTVESKDAHQRGLDALGLVNEGLGADFEAADAHWVDLILFQQVRQRREHHGGDVLTVRAERELVHVER